MTLAIFVEGPSDKDAIPVLLSKFRRPSRHVRIVGSDEMLDAAAMERHIAVLMSQHRDVSAVLVFRDSEGTDPEQTLLACAKPLARLRERFRRLFIEYIVVDHSIEGWLGADQTAVKAVIGQDARFPHKWAPTVTHGRLN